MLSAPQILKITTVPSVSTVVYLLLCSLWCLCDHRRKYLGSRPYDAYNITVRCGHTMLRYDLHMHTTYSRDGAIRPADAIRIAKKRKLDGIAITDHNTIRGGMEAQKLPPNGLDIICGAEMKTDRGDVIGLFLNGRDPLGRSP